MAAASAARNRDDERMLKSATAQRMRRAEQKQPALLMLPIQTPLALLKVLVLHSWAAVAAAAMHAQASMNAAAAAQHENTAETTVQRNAREAHTTCR
jgi:DUF1365 family protein